MNFIEKLFELNQQKINHVVITLTAIRGSAPQEIGSKMIVTTAGHCFGSVGGGKIEAHVIEVAIERLKQQEKSISFTWNLQTDIHMTCGGEVTLFFDIHYFNDFHIAIFGAGHISQHLCRVLQYWSCQIQVFDDRKNWLDELPSAHNLEKIQTPIAAEEVMKLSKNSYLICITQGHESDLPILETALRKAEHFAFIGVIGSKQKAAKLKQDLRIREISEAAIDKLIIPIGLPIGNNSPAEIAVSIAAQILAVRDNVSFSLQDGKLR